MGEEVLSCANREQECGGGGGGAVEVGREGMEGGALKCLSITPSPLFPVSSLIAPSNAEAR